MAFKTAALPYRMVLPGVACGAGSVGSKEIASAEYGSSQRQCAKVVQHWAGKPCPGAGAWERAVGVADAGASAYAAAAREFGASRGMAVCGLGCERDVREFESAATGRG